MAYLFDESVNESDYVDCDFVDGDTARIGALDPKAFNEKWPRGEGGPGLKFFRAMADGVQESDEFVPTKLRLNKKLKNVHCCWNRSVLR